MDQTRLYLDYNATAPMKPEARDVMIAALGEIGNASSVHAHGRTARARVETAREQVAALIKSQATYVTFTSGATESNNAVLKAFAGERILVSAIEHPSVLEAAPNAELIPVTRDGVVDMDAYEALLDSDPAPALISVMMANNETGAIQHVAKMAKIAKKKYPSVHFHCDAVQGAGRLPIEFGAFHLDYLSLSAHKMGGPQGVGALIVAPGARAVKFMHGGGQEKRQRAGTENVAAIAGFGRAAEIADRDCAAFGNIAKLRDHMEAQLKEITPELVIIAQNAPRLANTANISLPGLSAQTLIMALDLEGISASSGSACSSGSIKPSHVALAMKLDDATIMGALRLSLGFDTTPADIDRLVAVWSKITKRLLHKG